MGQVVTQELATIGDTTMPLGGLAQAMEAGGAGFASIEDFIYGDTPMRTSMRVVADWLERGLMRQANTPTSKQPCPIIVVISDADSTDGGPREYFDRIRAAGVIIVCCYVTDTAIEPANALPTTPDPNCSKGGLGSCFSWRPRYTRTILPCRC